MVDIIELTLEVLCSNGVTFHADFEHLFAIEYFLVFVYASVFSLNLFNHSFFDHLKSSFSESILSQVNHQSLITYLIQNQLFEVH